MNIGNVYQQLGDYEKALFHYNTALPVLESQLGLQHANVAMTEGNIGNLYERLGDYEKALFHFNKAHDIFVRSLGPDHHNTQQAARALERLQVAPYGGQAAGGVHSMSQERKLPTSQLQCCGVQCAVQ